MIIHIPHSSRVLNDYVELKNEKENLDCLTDDYVVELFNYPEHTKIIFPCSRLVCDVERFRQDDPMESFGQGVIYRFDCFGNKIKRNISDKETYKLYDEHHKELNQSINFALSLFDKVVLVDAHTYTPNNYTGPDICIGTDFYHTPLDLIQNINNIIDYNDLTSELDFPYKGTLVPNHLYGKNDNFHSIMIEVNKKSVEREKDKMKDVIYTILKEIEKYEE